uniref:Uncharacterized protein n=1 Tax=Romanomermis culicivorax TaxID=13658 RepID=A0A915L603_ROMCU
MLGQWQCWEFSVAMLGWWPWWGYADVTHRFKEMPGYFSQMILLARISLLAETHLIVVAYLRREFSKRVKERRREE